MSTRRSTRVNKGQHSKRSIDEIYADEQGDFKLVKKDDDTEYQGGNHESGQEEEEGVVRCKPCGATAENYDEETDTGGTMIQCDKCNSWQHSKCMGFRTAKDIPDYYECDVCNPQAFEERLKDPRPKKKPKKLTETTPFGSLKEPHRISTAKAFSNFFEISFPDDYKYPSGYDKQSLAIKWALEVENIIYEDFPKSNYNSESRRILFLLKKRFIGDLIDGNLTFKELANKTPEEINQNILKIKKQLKENIKNIVLVQADEQQIIRRTHKGEEIRDDYNEQPDEIDQSITTKSVDHRRFSEQEDSIPMPNFTKRQNSVQNTYFHSDDDDDDDDVDLEPQPQPENSLETATSKPEIKQDSGSESSELDHVAEPINDEALFKLTGENLHENVNGPQVWSGRLTFPEYASFDAKGELYSSTAMITKNEDINITTAIAKDILFRHAYEVEGRLDRDKADKYLNAIIKSRDIMLIKITGDSEDYQKLYDYLLIRNKVGVLTGKPTFVKDSYLIPIDFRDEKLPQYLVHHKRGLQIGLFALYVVRKDYQPSSTNISVPTTKSTLDDIMSQLGG